MGGASGQVTVLAPRNALGGLAARPTSVTGGGSLLLTVSPSTTQTANTSVTLSSDQPKLLALPASVSIGPSRSASVTVATQPVTAPTPVVVTATVGTERLSLKLVVNP
jgi:hypothetical protein